MRGKNNKWENISSAKVHTYIIDVEYLIVIFEKSDLLLSEYISYALKKKKSLNSISTLPTNICLHQNRHISDFKWYALALNILGKFFNTGDGVKKKKYFNVIKYLVNRPGNKYHLQLTWYNVCPWTSVIEVGIIKVHAQMLHM